MPINEFKVTLREREQLVYVNYFDTEEQATEAAVFLAKGTNARLVEKGLYQYKRTIIRITEEK